MVRRTPFRRAAITRDVATRPPAPATVARYLEASTELRRLLKADIQRSMTCIGMPEECIVQGEPERVLSDDMGRDNWEDRCQDEAALAPMGTLDTPTARAARAPQPCHGISARARKLSAPATLTRHGTLATPMPGMPASQPQTCHDSPWPWPCHDTVPQQVLGHQPSQANTAGNRQRSATTPDGHHQWRSTTTPTGARWGKEEEGPQSRRSTTTHRGASSGGAAVDGGGRRQDPRDPIFQLVCCQERFRRIDWGDRVRINWRELELLRRPRPGSLTEPLEEDSEEEA
ncbi:hypothetical protein CJ030_MR3G012331 [Morella rubra]|uniref:Uncharacterized protein n=1 Tax=Morella rubra TaxID=262757 RepID=A0A6A1W366_9ROSI|nr:hypothetical protein CJ030_MR3G012331 [Morella rubra]